MGEKKIELKDIYKTYDNKNYSVKDFNLSINEGEFVVFVGPSGCGKTTTLRMIAGLEDISKGQLLIDGKLMNDVAPKDRDLAMVFQNYALYPHMTVFDNISYPLKLRGMDKDLIHDKVLETSDMLDIKHLLEKKPGMLSGGEKQRVALGRCIVRNPVAFLMDEPLSNLDFKLRLKMRGEIIRLQNRLHKTFIYVTHDQSEALTMGDKIVVMRKGEILQLGDSYEIYNRPNCKFVAEFIGSAPMNFIEVDKTLKLGENTYSFSYEKPFYLAFRPEAVSSSLKEGIGFSLILDSVEDLGSEKYLHGRLGESEITIRDTSKKTYQLDEAYRFYVGRENLIYFDRENEKAIENDFTKVK